MHLLFIFPFECVSPINFNNENNFSSMFIPPWRRFSLAGCRKTNNEKKYLSWFQKCLETWGGCLSGLSLLKVGFRLMVRRNAQICLVEFYLHFESLMMGKDIKSWCFKYALSLIYFFNKSFKSMSFSLRWDFHVPLLSGPSKHKTVTLSLWFPAQSLGPFLSSPFSHGSVSGSGNLGEEAC